MPSPCSRPRPSLRLALEILEDRTAPVAGLVAAYAFDEGSGLSTADASGNGNNGTLANAASAAAGKNGKALSFNGSNSWVTVADANSLDLTSGMTLEAWVRPASLGGWGTVVMKETDGEVYQLYASDGTGQPVTYLSTTSGP